MKKIFLLAIIFALVTGASFLSCKTASKTSTSKLLKFNLEKGKGYDYEMVWDVNSAMGQLTNVSMDALYSMNVSADDGQVKTITTLYKSIKMKMGMGPMEITIDTDKPVEDTSGRIFQAVGKVQKVLSAVVGKPFTMKVDAEGNILELKGMNAIVESMLDSVGMDEQAKIKAREAMKDQFNDETIKGRFAMVFTFFPNKEVKTGDSWEKTYSIGGNMGGKFSTTYTVKDIDGDHVSLTLVSKISSGDGGEISGSQTGNLLVDSKTGLMIDGEFEQELQTKNEGKPITIKSKGRIKGKAN